MPPRSRSRDWPEPSACGARRGSCRRCGAGGSRAVAPAHEVEEPVVHPNEIKRLSTGQLVLLSNVPTPRVARTTVARAASPVAPLPRPAGRIRRRRE